MNGVRQENGDKLNNAGNKNIRFGSNGVVGLSAVKNKGIFYCMDGALNNNSVAVKIIPMHGISRNTRIKAKVFIRISVNTSAIR